MALSNEIAKKYELAGNIKYDSCSNRHLFCIHRIMAMFVMIISFSLTIVDQYAIRHQDIKEYEFTNLVINACNTMIIALIGVFGSYNKSKGKDYLLDNENNAAYKLSKQSKKEQKAMLVNEKSESIDMEIAKNISSAVNSSAPPLTEMNSISYNETKLYPPLYNSLESQFVNPDFSFELSDNYEKIRVTNKLLNSTVLMDRALVASTFGGKVLEALGD